MTEKLETKDPDVIIIGAGMAGGLLAVALAETGLQIQLLDAAPVPVMPKGPPATRVSALTEASQRMLKATGVWQSLPQERICAWQGMSVWDADGTGCVDFTAAEAGAGQLGWLVENDALVAALHKRCEAIQNIDWQTSANVVDIRHEGNHWHVKLADDIEQPTPLLVGADGAQSLVRRCAGIAATPRDSGHVAIVASIQCQQAHDCCARQRFMESGPLALLPLAGAGHDVSLVWSLWPQHAETLMGMTDDDFCRELTQATESVLGELKLLTPRAAFPVRELHASNYIRPGLALIGDAAHVVHPLAGQGINLGLLDAAVLAEEIARQLKRGLPHWHEQGLLRYQRRRRAHNLIMQNAFRGFKILFEQRAPSIRFARNLGMTMVNDLQPLKNFFAHQALGRGGDLPTLAR